MTDTQTLAPARQLAETNKARFPNESTEYRAARNALLVEEIELRRHIERVASQRRALPAGGQLPQDFALVSEKGPVRLSTLLGDKDTLMIYSMMYGPQRQAPCPMCTSFLSSWNGTAIIHTYLYAFMARFPSGPYHASQLTDGLVAASRGPLDR